jgi:cytochrome c553
MRTPPRNIVFGVLVGAVVLSAVLTGLLHAQGVPATGPTLPATATAQDSSGLSSEVVGATLFRTYCATCHEGPGANPQAPGREVMSRMSAEQILESLERGAMQTRAAERSRAQRRALAEYASAKPLAVDSDGSMPKSAFCGAAAAPRTDTLVGPAWNGWGHSVGNTRYQSADAAGLTADDLRQFRLLTPWRNPSRERPARFWTVERTPRRARCSRGSSV